MKELKCAHSDEKLPVQNLGPVCSERARFSQSAKLSRWPVRTRTSAGQKNMFFAKRTQNSSMFTEDFEKIQSQSNPF